MYVNVRVMSVEKCLLDAGQRVDGKDENAGEGGGEEDWEIHLMFFVFKLKDKVNKSEK